MPWGRVIVTSKGSLKTGVLESLNMTSRAICYSYSKLSPVVMEVSGSPNMMDVKTQIESYPIRKSHVARKQLNCCAKKEVVSNDLEWVCKLGEMRCSEDGFAWLTEFRRCEDLFLGDFMASKHPKKQVEKKTLQKFCGTKTFTPDPSEGYLGALGGYLAPRGGGMTDRTPPDTLYI